jgi:hypothetical protein
MPRASGHTRAIAPLRLLELTLVFCVAVVGMARPAWAGGATNYTYQVLFDTDNNPATGCNVPVADKTVSTTFLGAERLVTVTVMRTGTGGIVTGITVQSCVNGTFGAAQPVSPGGWPVGKGDGVGGGDVIEAFVPATVLGGGGGLARVAFTASQATPGPGSDVMLTTADGAPILFALPVFVPALSTPGLALSVLLLGGAALWALRRRPRAHHAALVALALTAGIATATTIVMDGQVGDWGSLPPVATHPAYESTNDDPAEDLLAGFLTTDSTNVYFRVDVFNICSSCSFAWSRTVNTIQHLVANLSFDQGCTKSDPYGSNACTWTWAAPVAVAFSGALQEDITSGKVVGNLELTDTIHGTTPFAFSCPICGADCTILNPFSAASETFAMPACPIHAMTIPVTITPFTPPRSPHDAIPAAVPAALRSAIENVFAELSVPASVAGTVQLADQSGGVIFKVSIAAEWQQ